MTRTEKSFRLALTKEQRALVLENTGKEAEELELTDTALRSESEPKPTRDKA